MGITFLDQSFPTEKVAMLKTTISEQPVTRASIGN